MGHKNEVEKIEEHKIEELTWEEEYKRIFIDREPQDEEGTVIDFIRELLHTAKANWLRERIKRLEVMRKDPSKGKLSGDMMFLEGFNQALQTIIDQDKKELAELENK